jgi:hypothetical protein
VAIERAVERVHGRRADAAAVDGAASTVLPYFFPDRATALESLAQRSTHVRGFETGVRAGRRLLARAAADGAETPWSGAVPVGPEFWVPTPPGFLPPLLPGWGQVEPWNVHAPAALLPRPPPRPGKAAFAREVREVYRVSQTLTPDQRAIALFWADGAGTFTPPGHWDAIASELLRTHRLPLRRGALLFATLNTAQADAFICAWLAKYTYWSLRPVTAIRLELDLLGRRSSRAALPELHLGPFDHFGRRRCGALEVLPPRGAAAPGLGSSGRGLAALWRDSLPQRQRGRPQGRRRCGPGGGRGLARALRLGRPSA